MYIHIVCNNELCTSCIHVYILYRLLQDPHYHDDYTNCNDVYHILYLVYDGLLMKEYVSFVYICVCIICVCSSIMIVHVHILLFTCRLILIAGQLQCMPHPLQDFRPHGPGQSSVVTNQQPSLF